MGGLGVARRLDQVGAQAVAHARGPVRRGGRRLARRRDQTLVDPLARRQLRLLAAGEVLVESVMRDPRGGGDLRVGAVLAVAARRQRDDRAQDALTRLLAGEVERTGAAIL